MKRIIFAVAGFALLLSVAWTGVTHAATLKGGEVVGLASGEVVDGTLYTGGRSLTIAGTVKGDIMCVGQDITVTGTVEGDVLCAGQTINISGHVTGSVRTASQTLDISGKVDGSVSSVAQSATLASGSTVGRDLTLGGQAIHLNTTVARDATVAADTFDTNGVVGRDLDVHATTITLGANTAVTGNFTYTSKSDAGIAQGAKVGHTQHFVPANNDASWRQTTAAMYVGSVLFGFTTFLVLGCALLLLSTRILSGAAEAIERSPLTTLGLGFVMLIVPPVLALFLLVSVVGVVLALVLILVWLLVLLLGFVFSAYALGNVIVRSLRWQGAWLPFLRLLLGLLVLCIVTLIPWLGGLIGFVAVVWGLGTIWYMIFTLRRNKPTKTPAKA